MEDSFMLLEVSCVPLFPQSERHIRHVQCGTDSSERTIAQHIAMALSEAMVHVASNADAVTRCALCVCDAGQWVGTSAIMGDVIRSRTTSGRMGSGTPFRKIKQIGK
ncbi:hypothetical protein M514_11578 [Trichuris suis]|uniref:Uncharacterized protein n=1 Tax=Trichuris suis TaxID=68888 RepID=A0A085LRD8_9BILA|nr:hypothetical protein M513_11578 [Trichuris suis]KFD60538.1 hypothetical protein M514_11578 [Trichuris suis]